MRKKQHSLIAAMLIFLLALPAFCASPFSQPSTFQNKVDGTVVYAADWNNIIGGLYTYVAGTLLPQLNALTTLGDMYVYSGSTLARLPVGTNGQVLTANSAAGNGLGINWAAGAGLPLTTKGDLVIANSGGSAARLPVGTDGYVLTSDSTTTNGAAWELVAGLNAAPGTIVMFYGTYGGAIPAGWVLCDGTNGTPNMIGMYPLGAQASGGVSTPNASGFGNAIQGTAYGSVTHTHTIAVSGNTGTPSSNVGIYNGNGAPFNAGNGGHYHAFSYSGTTGSTSQQPASVGLIFMMKS